MMKVISNITEMRKWSQDLHRSGKRIGLVPTMGYLHEGHLSLVREAKKDSDVVVVSIYVNPTQFGPNEDLDKYPRDFQRDLDLCQQEKVDIVFAPENKKMYSPGHQTFVINEKLSSVLCGRTRPIHFRGVTTIVSKLFNIIDPDISVFGQKDAQQAAILKTMVRDLNFHTAIITAPIVRETDGLAMSSRNKYLNPSQRQQALVLSQSLKYAREQFNAGNKDTSALQNEIMQKINTQPECRVDYVEFVNADTFEQQINPGEKILLAIAVFVGQTRLIDNTVLSY